MAPALVWSRERIEFQPHSTPLATLPPIDGHDVKEVRENTVGTVQIPFMIPGVHTF
jgi:hypothetical protein